MASQRFIPYSVAMVTPFTKAGNLDVASVPQVVKYYLDCGIPGLLISGSTGEQHCMTIAERKQLYRSVTETVAGTNCQIYAGVAAFKTDDVKELAAAAQDAGCSGIMLGFPPYRIPTQQEAELYIREVASAASNLPIFLYNNPRRNGFAMEPETFARVAAAVPNVYGQKEAGNPENVNVMKKLLLQQGAAVQSEEYSFLSGSDSSFIEAFTKHGYTGITSIAGNVYPDEVKSMVDHLLRNEVEEAKEIMHKIAPGIGLLEKVGMIQGIKFLLRKKNVPIGYCVAPMMDVGGEAQKALEETFL